VLYVPAKRKGTTYGFKVGDIKGYLITCENRDGKLCEIFIRVAKQGSTLAAIVDALAKAVSLGLQHDVPLQYYIDAYTDTKFEPSGFTNDKDIKESTSIIDYVFRRLELDYIASQPTVPETLNAMMIPQLTK
jgi:ribonucleoside-diphosphate reductase alpha chain